MNNIYIMSTLYMVYNVEMNNIYIMSTLYMVYNVEMNSSILCLISKFNQPILWNNQLVSSNVVKDR